MIVQNVITHLEELSPLTYAEEYDNVGLLVGNRKAQVTGVLVTLDTTEDVIEEALINKCNLIVSFHPIIFKGLKLASGMSKLIFSKSSSKTLEILLSEIETGVPLIVTDSFVNSSK